MVLLSLLFGATVAAMDVIVTCDSAPRYYTIDGMANRQLSIRAGDSISFSFDEGCAPYPMQIRGLDGTPVSSSGNVLVTSASTPECLIYLSTTQPNTMTGTISVIGGTQCGASVTTSTLYNRPVITPLPAPLYPATTPLYVPSFPTLPTSIYATGSVSLYTPTLPVVIPTACVGLYCLPCCPAAVAGQACRNCLTFV